MKVREQKEFTRDMAYMKLDIWEDGEIEKTFGHDPATYPNQDNPQHYPHVQFAGNPASNNKNHVLQDSESDRTGINHALRAWEDNAAGKFARDGYYMREDLWQEVPVEPVGVERTPHGKEENFHEFASRTGGREEGKPAKFEFTKQHGYMQSDILTPSALPEAPVEVPEEPKECPPEESGCADGTLGKVLAAGDKAAEAIEKSIQPIEGGE